MHKLCHPSCVCRVAISVAAGIDADFGDKLLVPFRIIAGLLVSVCIFAFLCRGFVFVLAAAGVDADFCNVLLASFVIFASSDMITASVVAASWIILGSVTDRNVS